MKATIHARVPAEKLRELVPPAYKDLVLKAKLEGAYTVLLFAHTERDVVTSMPVRRALRRLDSTAPDGLLAVGTTFTAEARELIREQGGRILALREGKWTDASARERQP